MNLLERLNMVIDWVNKPNFDDWQSLVINKRRPETYRMFRFLPDGTRVCLHRFSACDQYDAFPHPHAWPMEVLVLSGYYRQDLYQAPNPNSSPSFSVPCSTHIHGPGSYYRLGDPLIFHRVVPKSEYVYTVMFNGLPWESSIVHDHILTTKGKDLDAMTPEEMGAHLSIFSALFSTNKKELRQVASYVA